MAKGERAVIVRTKNIRPGDFLYRVGSVRSLGLVMSVDRAGDEWLIQTSIWTFRAPDMAYFKVTRFKRDLERFEQAHPGRRR